MLSRLRSWLGRLPARDSLERTYSVGIQTACIVATVGLVVGLTRGVQVGAPAPLLARDAVNLVVTVSTVILLRAGRGKLAWRFLVGGVATNYLVWLAVLGLEFNRYELLQLAIPLTAMALLLGRAWLWLGFVAAAAAVVIAGLRDAGVLWAPGPRPAFVPAITLPGATVAVMGIIAVLLDRFGLTVRQALDAALLRERDLARANEALRQEAIAHLRTNTMLVQSQRLEAVGRLAGGVAHDFNNILTSVVFSAHLARESLPAQDPARAELDQILLDAERATALTRQLLAFARRQVLQPHRVDVGELVRRLEKMLRRLLGEDVDLAIDTGPEPTVVLIDPGQLEQVLVNLTVNARDAMPTGGRLSIAVRLADPPGEPPRSSPPVPGHVLIEVADEGVGLASDVVERIFEPFFTTKQDGAGTGLGLPTCRGIVEQAGGSISVSSEPGAGTTFRVLLPRSVGAPEHLPAGDASHARGGSEVVLVAEDEQRVRTLSVRMLRGLGYSVLEADSVEDASAVAGGHRGDVDLLVADVVLRGGSGRDLAARLQERWPRMKVLFVSGYTDDAMIRHGVETGGVAFLPKPFAPETLARKVRDVLDAGASQG